MPDEMTWQIDRLSPSLTDYDLDQSTGEERILFHMKIGVEGIGEEGVIPVYSNSACYVSPAGSDPEFALRLDEHSKLQRKNIGGNRWARGKMEDFLFFAKFMTERFPLLSGELLEDLKVHRESPHFDERRHAALKDGLDNFRYDATKGLYIATHTALARDPEIPSESKNKIADALEPLIDNILYIDPFTN
jgi:hypothetical protein